MALVLQGCSDMFMLSGLFLLLISSLFLTIGIFIGDGIMASSAVVSYFVALTVTFAGAVLAGIKSQ